MFFTSMVLPRPFGPMSTILAASSMKARERTSSTSGRSHCVGHFQSKSATGLKTPMRAASRRRLKLRRARSASSMTSNWGSQGALMTVSALASRPYRPRRCRRSRKFSRFNGSIGGLVLIAGLLGQLFVVAQVMGAHGDVHARIIGQSHGDGRRRPAQRQVLVDEVAHGA